MKPSSNVQKMKCNRESGAKNAPFLCLVAMEGSHESCHCNQLLWRLNGSWICLLCRLCSMAFAVVPAWRTWYVAAVCAQQSRGKEIAPEWMQRRKFAGVASRLVCEFIIYYFALVACAASKIEPRSESRGSVLEKSISRTQNNTHKCKYSFDTRCTFWSDSTTWKRKSFKWMQQNKIKQSPQQQKPSAGWRHSRYVPLHSFKLDARKWKWLFKEKLSSPGSRQNGVYLLDFTQIDRDKRRVQYWEKNSLTFHSTVRFNVSDSCVFVFPPLYLSVWLGSLARSCDA